MRKMKKLIILVIVLNSSINAFSQINDLKLANMLIGQDVNIMDSILDSAGYLYTITDKSTFEQTQKFYVYIESQFGIKLWEITALSSVKVPKAYRDIIKNNPSTISVIFVRYRHSNFGDLRDFKAYPTPISNDSISYEKKMGKNLSHLKVSIKDMEIE